MMLREAKAEVPSGSRLGRGRIERERDRGDSGLEVLAPREGDGVFVLYRRC